MLVIRIQRNKLQEKIDKIAGNEYLQFIYETQNPGGVPSGNETKTTSILMEKSFPLLVPDSFYYKSVKLEFQAHQKKNQLIKYLNKESTRTKATFKAISNGVLNRLEKITSRMSITSIF